MSGVQSPNSLALARGTIPRIVAAKTSSGWWKEFPGPLVSFDDTERLPCPRPPCPSTPRLRFFRPIPQKGIPQNTSCPDGLVSDCVCVCVHLWTLVSASISRCDCGYVWLCECHVWADVGMWVCVCSVYECDYLSASPDSAFGRAVGRGDRNQQPIWTFLCQMGFFLA